MKNIEAMNLINEFIYLFPIRLTGMEAVSLGQHNNVN